MKTSILHSAHIAKAIVFQLIVVSCFAFQTVSAQSATLVNQPAPANVQTSSSSFGFKALSFPLTNAQKVRVVFEDPTGRGAVIQIRDSQDRILHSQNCFHKKRYAGNFDISALPDGPYSVAIVALTKAGFKKQTFIHTFQMETKTKRSLTLLDKKMEKETEIPRPYQVRR